VGALGCAALPELLELVDLSAWFVGVAELRRELTELLTAFELNVRRSDSNWVLVDRAGLREELAPHGVVVRDCASFGMPDVTRIAVPSSEDLERLAKALEAAALQREGLWSQSEPVR
jgi:histidinol-phosphate/aromatic aminotransferase/cobyric acid decarboxylase-like protein